MFKVSDIPLLTELEPPLRHSSYKHIAPDGAFFILCQTEVNTVNSFLFINR